MSGSDSISREMYFLRSLTLHENSGEILSVHSDSLIIGTKDGAISIKKVRIDGKKVTATEFINDYKITIGTICS